jgi:hypothetical protein
MNKIKSLLTIAVVFCFLCSIINFTSKVNATTPATIYSFEQFNNDSNLLYSVDTSINSTSDSVFGHSITNVSAIDGNYLNITGIGTNKTRWFTSSALNNVSKGTTIKNSTFGFWLRPQSSVGDGYFWITVTDANGIGSLGLPVTSGYLFQMSYYHVTGLWSYMVAWYDGAYHQFIPPGLQYMSADNWYWIEFHVYYYLGSYVWSFYSNGTQKGAFSGFGDSPTQSHVYLGYYYYNDNSFMAGHIGIDNVRFADNEEFPPILLGTPNNVQVTSIPINGSVLWEDGVVYDLPHTFSAFAGMNHNITAMSTLITSDPSIRYLFQGWSIDGSSTIDTSNPLIFNPGADMTLEAVYSLVEITDYSSTVTFGIGLFGFILIGLSWVVGYHFYKEL